MAVADASAGQTATLGVWRNGHERNVTVTIGTQSEDQTAATGEHDSHERVGMTLAPLSPDERDRLGLNPSARGVVVENVVPGSLADQSGVQAGDRIRRINNEPVSSPGKVIAKLHQAERDKKEAVPMLVTRNAAPYYLALQLRQG